MAKDQRRTELDALSAWLRTGEGSPPEAWRADAERARAAMVDRRPSEIATLAVDVQLAAVEALTASRDADALQALEEATPHKEVRKAAGKGLHQLRTKGIRAAETPRGQGFRYHTVEGEEPRSYVSLADPEGDRMVWFGAQVKQRGRMAFQAVVNETTGIGLFQVFPQMTAKMRRKILDELLGSKIPVYEVDNAYARWLIEEGARRNEATGTEIPKEYYEALPMMGPADDLSSDPHPVYALLMEKGVAGEPTAAELRASATLLDLEEIRAWRPGPEILEKLRGQLELAKDSVLVLDDRQKREQYQVHFERAAREYFVSETRDRWSRRLLDLAHHLALKDRLGEARAALAAAEQIAEAESDPTANPFAMELFLRAFGPEPEAERPGPEHEAEGEGEEPPRIVIP